MNKYWITAVSILLLAAFIPASAQSGGGFEITEGVVGGGGDQAANNDISVDSTVGQAVATGPIGFGSFVITTGFWNFTPLTPTAAHVSVAGRVVDLNGNGVFNAQIFLQSQDGSVRLARSSPMGYFQFDTIISGQTVLIAVQSKTFTYTTRAISVVDDVVDLIIAPEQPASMDRILEYDNQ